MASTLPTTNDCCSLCSGQTVTIVTTTTPGSDNGFFVAETLAALRAIASSSNNKWCSLLGDAAKYDFGPAKEYYWDPTSVDADNPFSVVVPSDAPAQGRWVQVQ